MRFPPKSSAGASSTSRSTRPASRSAAWTATNPPRLDPMSATGPGGTACDRVMHLPEHAADGQRREVGRVEVRGLHLDAVRRELRPEERGLGRLRGRSEAVQVQRRASQDDLAARPAAARDGARAVGVVVVGQLFTAPDVSRRANPDRLANDLRVAIRAARVVDEAGHVAADGGIARVEPVQLEAPDVPGPQVAAPRASDSRGS